MAVSLTFRILFAVVVIATPVLKIVAQRRWQETGDGIYLELAKRWSKGTAIRFADGAVSGVQIYRASRPIQERATMTDIEVRTERLQLTPLSADAVEALLRGDAARLRSLTEAEFATPTGPPPYMAESLPVVQDRLRENPAEARWWNWLVVRRDNREAVGSVAFGGMPDTAGSVLIGYAMYPAREGSGYATEAVRAMVDWAFAQPGVKIVRALAPVWNTPAVHVAEKVGMRPVGSYEDDEVGEVLIYETVRS